MPIEESDLDELLDLCGEAFKHAANRDRGKATKSLDNIRVKINQLKTKLPEKKKKGLFRR